MMKQIVLLPKECLALWAICVLLEILFYLGIVGHLFFLVFGQPAYMLVGGQVGLSLAAIPTLLTLALAMRAAAADCVARF